MLVDSDKMQQLAATGDKALAASSASALERNLHQFQHADGKLKDIALDKRLLGASLDFESNQYALLNRIPLASNGSCVRVIDEHCGQVFFSKWNPATGRRYLATGGAGDNFVDVWDYDTILNQQQTAHAALLAQTQPLLQLRHVSVTKNEQVPARANDNHFISSIQWSHSGDRLLTSAHDNIARVWGTDGRIASLFRSQNRLICSAWNKSDTLIASGGEETGVLIWNPALDIQKEPMYKLNQPGEIIDIVWQHDSQLAAASQTEIYLWSIEQPGTPQMVWRGHENLVENIKWDQKGVLLASQAQEESQLLIWSPKSRNSLLCINEHEQALRFFSWSNVDVGQANAANVGHGFIVTLTMDQIVRLYDITGSQPECFMQLKHDHFVSSLALSPDNSLLAVGGLNSEVSIWSLRDQKLLRVFYKPDKVAAVRRKSKSGGVNGASTDLQAGTLENQEMEDLEKQALEDDPHCKQVFDLNWSCDGTVLAAGIEKYVIMLDMRQILSTTIETLVKQGQQALMPPSDKQMSSGTVPVKLHGAPAEVAGAGLASQVNENKGAMHGPSATSVTSSNLKGNNSEQRAKDAPSVVDTNQAGNGAGKAGAGPSGTAGSNSNSKM